MKRFIKKAFSNPVALSLARMASNVIPRERKAVIINFHQFYDGSYPLLKKGPSVHTHASDLDEFLKLLKTRYEVMSLSDLVRRITERQALDFDSVAVTIDDGYRNNLSIGLPVFQDHKVPVTLYIATGYVGTSRMLPMETLAYVLLSTSNQEVEWPLNSGQVFTLSPLSGRALANRQIGAVLKTLSPSKLEFEIASLAERLSVDLREAPRTMLNWDEVRQLDASGVEIGSHAVSHNIMSRMPFDEACSELLQSKDVIERNLGKTVRHFAFPNGRVEDFNDELRSYAEGIGYISVASSRRGACLPGKMSAMDLSRVGLVGDIPTTMAYIERLFW